VLLLQRLLTVEELTLLLELAIELLLAPQLVSIGLRMSESIPIEHYG
jgi:hypothetical protein